jgi:hypothetical protein
VGRKTNVVAVMKCRYETDSSEANQAFDSAKGRGHHRRAIRRGRDLDFWVGERENGRIEEGRIENRVLSDG